MVVVVIRKGVEFSVIYDFYFVFSGQLRFIIFQLVRMDRDGFEEITRIFYKSNNF